jgi:hypothetical protein
MEALEKSPVPTGRQQEVFRIGKSVGPGTADDTDGEVLVDHDHGRAPVWCRSAVSIGVRSAQKRIVQEVGVKGNLEFVCKVTGYKAQKRGTVFRQQAGVTSPATAPTLFGYINGNHGLYSARLNPQPVSSDEL